MENSRITNCITRTWLLAVLAMGGLVLSACMAVQPPGAPSDAASAGDEVATYSGPVTEIAIRRLQESQDAVEFAAARDAFVAALTAEPGVGVDREFAAIIDSATFAPPVAAVFTGMTQYDNLTAFADAGEKLGESPEAAAFFATFEPQLFTALRPKAPTDQYDLGAMLTEPEQILEVAVRDLSLYDDFDSQDYETRLGAFLEMLSQQPGFVAEYQWVSVLDPDIVVGMTVYESIDAFTALAQDQQVLAQMMPFIDDYPPFTGYIHVDARR